MPGLLACAACGAANLTDCPKPPEPQLVNPAPLRASGQLPSATEAASKVASQVPPAATPPEVSLEPLEQVEVLAAEPRYVAPTLRDRIGRIWAPVLIDGKGPFRLVLDTGASHSAVTAGVARELGMRCSSYVRLHGVMGTVDVPSIRVENLIVGDLQIDSTSLPIVPDALGGAEGVLGTEGLLDKRIFIDFRHDLITIKRSHGQRADAGYVTVPVTVLPHHLLATTAYIGSIRTTAIIDTGAQTSIANLALRQALLARRRHYQFSQDQITDTTDTVGEGQGADVPPIRLGTVSIRSAHLTIDDVEIFQAWNLNDSPAVLIGMDALGTVDVLVIDYRRNELQILVRGEGMEPDRSDGPMPDFGRLGGLRDPRS